MRLQFFVMLTLAINTATNTTEVVFLRDGNVLKKGSWPAEANESDLLLPYLKDSLEESGLTFDDLTGLFVVRGPGSFTALRVGITIVNTLAFILKIPIYSLKTDEITGPLAESLLEMDFSKMKKEDIVEPYYDKPPKITPSKK
ncbi:MAG: tRNA (adenosine(37)-N6)-threonylcarbamoyltransferase complex dimerization subunit type 1 TsaB [Patescibacteria group bacterium]|nr:tRNA (adenosine(37)-N6)-threonylcarbamoyltransferase complex dimerization subunit type 1 TsaB [Patescibacteria group bacterium]